METTIKKSKDMHGATAAKLIRGFETLEEAEEFISDTEDRQVVLSALQDKKSFSEEAGGAPQLATLDRFVAGVHQLAADGYSGPRDFNDKEASFTKRPDYLPDFDSNGRALYYPWIGKENLMRHDFLVGDKKFCVPVTRAIFPEIDRSHLNVDGYIQKDDLICCVGLEENAIRYREMEMAQQARMVNWTKERRQKLAQDGELKMGVTSNVGPQSSLRESMAKISKSI